MTALWQGGTGGSGPSAAPLQPSPALAELSKLHFQHRCSPSVTPAPKATFSSIPQTQGEENGGKEEQREREADSHHSCKLQL